MPRWVQEGTDPLGLAKDVPNRGDVSAVRVGGDAALAAQMAAATTTTNYSNSNGINSAPDKDVSKTIKKKKHADDLLPCADDLLSIVVRCARGLCARGLCWIGRFIVERLAKKYF